MLLNPTPNIIKIGLSPNTNTTPVHFTGSAHAAKDDISNIIVMISSQEDNELNLPKKTPKQTENDVPYHDFGLAQKKSNGKSSVVANNFIGLIVVEVMHLSITFLTKLFVLYSNYCVAINF